HAPQDPIPNDSTQPLNLRIHQFKSIRTGNLIANAGPSPVQNTDLRASFLFADTFFVRYVAASRLCRERLKTHAVNAPQSLAAQTLNRGNLETSSMEAKRKADSAPRSLLIALALFAGVLLLLFIKSLRPE